jgi:hypothetical protein
MASSKATSQTNLGEINLTTMALVVTKALIKCLNYILKEVVLKKNPYQLFTSSINLTTTNFIKAWT